MTVVERSAACRALPDGGRAFEFHLRCENTCRGFLPVERCDPVYILKTRLLLVLRRGVKGSRAIKEEVLLQSTSVRDDGAAPAGVGMMRSVTFWLYLEGRIRDKFWLYLEGKSRESQE